MLRKPILKLIRFYQRLISPLFPKRCRFHPSCSQYAYECFHQFNLLKAFYKTMSRISRCHPFHPGGYDPVIPPP